MPRSLSVRTLGIFIHPITVRGKFPADKRPGPRRAERPAASGDPGFTACDPRDRISSSDVNAPPGARTGRLWFPYPTSDLRRKVAAIAPGPKVLYISGYPAGSGSVWYIFEGGKHFRQKPFTIAELLDRVHRVMDAAV